MTENEQTTQQTGGADYPTYVPRVNQHISIRLSPQAYNWWDTHITHSARRKETRKDLILSAFHGSVFEETLVHNRNVRGVCIYLETLRKHASIFGRGTDTGNPYPLWQDNRPDHLKDYTDPTYGLQTWDDGPYDTSIPMRYIHLTRISLETVNWLIDLALHFKIIPYDAYMRPYRLDSQNHLTPKKATYYMSAVMEAIGLEYLTNQFLYRSDILYDYFTQALPVLSPDDIERYSTISPITGMPPTIEEWKSRKLTDDQILLRKCLKFKKSEQNMPFNHQTYRTLEHLILTFQPSTIDETQTPLHDLPVKYSSPIIRVAQALAQDTEQPQLLQIDTSLNQEACRRNLAEQSLKLPDDVSLLIRTKSILRTVLDPSHTIRPAGNAYDTHRTFLSKPYKFSTPEELEQIKQRQNELRRQRSQRTAPMRKVERTIKKLEVMGIELDQQTIEDMYRQAGEQTDNAS